MRKEFHKKTIALPSLPPIHFLQDHISWCFFAEGERRENQIVLKKMADPIHHLSVFIPSYLWHPVFSNNMPLFSMAFYFPHGFAWFLPVASRLCSVAYWLLVFGVHKSVCVGMCWWLSTVCDQAAVDEAMFTHESKSAITGKPWVLASTQYLLWEHTRAHTHWTDCDTGVQTCLFVSPDCN